MPNSTPIPAKWLKLAAAALTVVLLAVVYDALRERLVNVGDTGPQFAITSDRGTKLTRSDFGGKVLVLNFWATWCPPCISELPSLNAMARTLAPKGVVVVGVSIDQDEKAYKAFVQRFKLSFETARDPEASISSEYGTFKIPETYVIGPDGKVLEKFVSDRDWMDPAILKRLEGYAR